MTDAPAGLREEIDRERGRVEWTLDQPRRRNAIAPAALRFIARRCAELDGETVVIRGAGEIAFCSGFDLTALAAARPTDAELPDDPLIAATAAITNANATFVASINGLVIGAGVELVCACDFRVAVAHASFRIPAAALGVVYHHRGAQRIAATFGRAAASQMLLLQHTVDAAEALRLGALIAVVPSDELAPATSGLVEQIEAADSRSLAGNRTLLRQLARHELDADVVRAHEARRHESYAALAKARDKPKPD